jgi:hypothetical protein
MNPEEENETKQALAPDTSSRTTGRDQQDLRTAYTELCISYRAIDDFRAKLLGFLPLATGTGIFLLYSNSDSGTEIYLPAIGIFGWVITLGLFAYGIYGIKKCHCLIKTGKSMEFKMNIRGQFYNRPPAVCSIINEPLASGIIYPAVLAAWTYLALTFSSTPIACMIANQIAGRIAVLVFFVFFILSMIFSIKLKSQRCKEAETAPETSL